MPFDHIHLHELPDNDNDEDDVAIDNPADETISRDSREGINSPSS